MALLRVQMRKSINYKIMNDDNTNNKIDKIIENVEKQGEELIKQLEDRIIAGQDQLVEKLKNLNN